MAKALDRFKGILHRLNSEAVELNQDRILHRSDPSKDEVKVWLRGMKTTLTAVNRSIDAVIGDIDCGRVD